MQDENSSRIGEPIVPYGKLSISSLEELSKMSVLATRNMTYEQRMQYLHKLISITHGEDLSEQEKKFYTGRIRINPAE